MPNGGSVLGILGTSMVIDISAVTHGDHDDQQHLIDDGIDDSVVPYTNSIARSSAQSTR
jgi:hypothetical protein